MAVPLALSSEVLGPFALCKHVDRSMLRRLCAASLEEYSAGHQRSAVDSDAKVDECLQNIDILGLRELTSRSDAGEGKNNDSRPMLCMLWELRNYLPESIALACALPHFVSDFVKDRFNMKRAVDDSDSEAVQIEFMSVLLHIVDRTPCKEGDTPLHELSWLKKSPERIAKWDKWENLVVAWHARCDQLPNRNDAEAVKFPVAPGTPLDAAVFIVVKERRLPAPSQISSLERHQLKLRIWNVGNILLKMHNCLQLPGEYITLSPLLRKCFRRVMYILADDINANVDDEDISQTIARREAAVDVDSGAPTDASPDEATLVA